MEIDKNEQIEDNVTTKYEFNTISDKKDFGSLGIPNYIIEYDPLNLIIKCPLYHRFMTNEKSKISIDDIDQIQLEMETLLLDTMKRLRLLKNELNANEIKMLKNNMNATVSSSSKSNKQSFKEKTFEKYFDRITFKSKSNCSLPPNYEIIERYIENPYPQLNNIDIPNQFWSFIHYFHDIPPNEKEIKQCAAFYDACEILDDDLLRMNNLINKKIDNNIDDDNKKGTTDDNQSGDNLVHNVQKFIHHQLLNDDKKPKENMYGPLTEKLMNSFIIINDDDNNNNNNVDKLKMKIEPNKSHKFEISLRKILKQLHLLQLKQQQKLNVGKIRQSLSTGNCLNELKKNYKHSLNDLIHDRLDQKLQSTFIKMFNTYKSIGLSKSMNLTNDQNNEININDYHRFDQLWQTRLRLIKYLNLFNRI